jgi:hypothetical protein
MTTFYTVVSWLVILDTGTHCWRNITHSDEATRRALRNGLALIIYIPHW